MLTLAEMLQTSEALEAKIASASDAAREELRQKKAMVDFAAFGTFKQSNFWPAAQKALGWGVGLGLPALGTGLILEHNAKSDAEDVINHARNQALLTGLGLGLGGITLGTMAGRNVMASDEGEDLRKLAAALLLDDVLVKQLGEVPDGEKRAVEACLLLNREHGTALLRKLLR